MNDAVLQRMRAQADAWEQAGDRRCVFLDCYALMTGNMLVAIEAGRFEDRVWIHSLLDRFAEYYFDALTAYEGGGPLPLPWKHAHDLARERLTTVEEDLLLGINAHINHDLPLALYDVMVGEWAGLTEEQRGARLQGHLTVNQVITETTAEVQHKVIDRFDHMLGFFDHRLPKLVEIADWEMDHVLSSWRTDVWALAVQLVEADDSGRVRLRELIEAASVHRVRLILVELRVRHEMLHCPSEELHRMFGPHHPFDPLRLRTLERTAATT